MNMLGRLRDRYGRAGIPGMIRGFRGLRSVRDARIAACIGVVAVERLVKEITHLALRGAAQLIHILVPVLPREDRGFGRIPSGSTRAPPFRSAAEFQYGDFLVSDADTLLIGNAVLNRMRERIDTLRCVS